MWCPGQPDEVHVRSTTVHVECRKTAAASTVFERCFQECTWTASKIAALAGRRGPSKLVGSYHNFDRPAATISCSVCGPVRCGVSSHGLCTAALGRVRLSIPTRSVA